MRSSYFQKSKCYEQNVKAKSTFEEHRIIFSQLKLKVLTEESGKYFWKALNSRVKDQTRIQQVVVAVKKTTVLVWSKTFLVLSVEDQNYFSCVIPGSPYPKPVYLQNGGNKAVVRME